MEFLERFDRALKLEKVFHAQSSLSILELRNERKRHLCFFMKSRDKIQSEFSVLVIFLDLVSEVCDLLWCLIVHIKWLWIEGLFFRLEPCFESSFDFFFWNKISAHLNTCGRSFPLTYLDHVLFEVLSIFELFSCFLVSFFTSSDFHFSCSCDHMWKS